MDRLANAFREFAKECHGSSAVYEALSLHIAGDEGLLALASTAQLGQPVPNLLFAAVHAILLRDGDADLSPYYGSLASDPLPPSEAFPAFRTFTLAHREEIETSLAKRLVQTNEVRRTIYLASALARLGREFPDRPFHLIEIGTSAGLNLLLDRFGYQYAGGKPFGDPASPVQLRSEVRGEHRPPATLRGVRVVGRVGVDLNPLDVRRPEDLFWLRALVWPEHAERRRLLERATELQSEAPVRLVAGDGIARLPDLVAEADPDAVVCVFHTHVANQMGAEGRTRLLATVEALGQERDLVHLHNNIEPHLHATLYRGGERKDFPLARVDGHARWVEWLDEG